MNDIDVMGLADRLRRLEDLAEIARLYSDYGRHLDDGDADAYASLFAAEAKLRLGPVMRADGREQIRQAAQATIEAQAGRGGKSVHVIGSPRIDLDGDTATGESVWAAVADGADGPTRTIVGRHLDDLVREDGRWRFARRRGFVDVGALR